MKLSVTIITFNEEQNIARAIDSASFADEIIVVDSSSSDKTVEIANKLGAKVVTSPFKGFGQQKNLAAHHANGEWIFSLDADEEISPELKNSILSTIKSTQEESFQIARRTSFCGKWIYHGGWYPDLLTRLYKKSSARWSEPEVHEELVPNSQKLGPLLDGHLNHYSFPTVRSQIERNVKYAHLGAQTLIKKNKRISVPHLLFKPLWKFFECYLLKKGFLDGFAGLIIALNAAHSIYMKYLFALIKEENR